MTITLLILLNLILNLTTTPISQNSDLEIEKKEKDLLDIESLMKMIIRHTDLETPLFENPEIFKLAFTRLKALTTQAEMS